VRWSLTSVNAGNHAYCRKKTMESHDGGIPEVRWNGTEGRDIDSVETNVHRDGDTGHGHTDNYADLTRHTPTKNTKNRTIVSYSDRFIPSRCVLRRSLIETLGLCISRSGNRNTGQSDPTHSLVFCRAGTSRLDCTVLERETVASQVPVKADNKDGDSASLYGMLLRSELLGCSSSLPASPEKGNTGNGCGASRGQDGEDTPGTGTRATEANMHYGLLESPMTHLGRRGTGAMDTSMSGSLPGTSPRGGSYPAQLSTTPKSPGSAPARKTLFRYVTDSSDAYGSVCKTAFQQRGIGLGGSNDDSSVFSFDSSFSPHSRLPRRINRSPFKVLDAPQLADDFYLNLVDWSAMNTLAVGLGSCVYLWSACTSKVTRLVDLGDDLSVCSVSWSQRGHYLSIGVDNGDVQIWDAVKCKKLRTMQGHRQRVGCMNWSHHVLATGSRDRNILMRDVRTPSHFYAKLSAHRSEVCGLKWSPDDRELASGGNDNLLMVWQPGQASSSDPVQRFTGHQAAVKAIAWSPHQHGLIASGGGTADRCIKFWNTSTGAALQSVDTGSQVCNLAWSKNINEIVSTHGYSQNQIVVWRYQGMQKLATLTGHTLRVLYLACSPDGQTIVTGAGDETLRFWNVFPGPKAQSGGEAGVGSMMRTVIR
jgi:cell division cycle 20-like protein 1 (cofactor of APC complex)